MSPDFPVVATVGRDKLVWVDSARIDESISAAREIGAAYLGVSPHHGYHLPDLTFLERYPTIERLDIPFAALYDLSPLRSLRQLKYLTLFGSNSELRASWFPSLEQLQTEWRQQLFLDGATHLKRLFLRGYRGGKAGLGLLPLLPSLTHLDITQGRFTSLRGVERCPSLQQLELHYIQSLLDGTDVCQLAGTLTSVWFSHVHGGIDLTQLRCLKQLERLRLNQCGTLPSIAFLNELPKLREFRFVQTVVEDGDLTPLLRLDAVGFFDRRGYSHKSKDIDKAIADRRARDGAA
jgi:protein phosphatase 1 regulatory subunit 7